MKNLKIAFTVLLVVMLASCKKEEVAETPTTTAKKPNRSARIDVGTPHQQSSCAQYEGIYYDKYIVYNNTWGSGNPGYQWQCIWSSAGSGWWSFGVTSGHNEFTGLIKGYPAAVRGWHYGMWSNNSGMPKQIGYGGGSNISWNMEIPNAGRYNSIIDLYFTRTSWVPADQRNTGLNIMVVLNERNFYYNGYWDGYVERTWIGGHEWHVIRKTRNENGNSFSWIILDKVNKTTSVSNLDIKAMFDYCANKNFVNRDAYLCSIQAGWEIIDGGGGAGFKTTYLNTNLW